MDFGPFLIFAWTLVFGWLLNTAYLALLLAFTPLILWRSLRHGRYRRGWKEKLFGFLPRMDRETKTVWFHAVSVGEILQLKQVVARFRQHCPQQAIVITTSTDTGYDVAARTFPDCTVTWLPWDFTWAVRHALERIHPEQLVLVELELWPNLISLAHRRGVRLSLINGRLSEGSYRGYRVIRPIVSRLLQQMHLLCVQTETHAQRFESLGADVHSIHVTGSLKFDGAILDRHNPVTRQIAAELQISPKETILLAGSTQAPEEQMALSFYRSLRHSFPALRLILVPRHPERFDEVAQLVESMGMPLRRRSTSAGHAEMYSGEPPVILLDSVGELSAAWGLADIAYVGGSLTPGRGGQNMLEPAAMGAAVFFGQHTENFSTIAAALIDRQAAMRIHDEQDFLRKAKAILFDETRRHEMGRAARQFVIEHQGAVEKTIQRLRHDLDQQTTGTKQTSRAA